MYEPSTSWYARFDRVVRGLQWLALGFGAFLTLIQYGATARSVGAIAIASSYVIAHQTTPFRYRRSRWTGELLAVIGVGASMVAAGLTGGTDSPFLLLTAVPTLYASAFFGWRIGIETGLLTAGALLFMRGIQESESIGDLVDSSVLAWAAIYLLLAVTFSYARKLLVEAGELVEASAGDRERLARLETANQLLSRLSSLADGSELNPVVVGGAALAGLEESVAFDAATVAISGEEGPVVVASQGDTLLAAERLTTPLTVGNREVGFVVLSREQEFSEDDRSSVSEALAPVALAFSNALLLQGIARKAVQEERTRLARELHDDIGPSLASLGLALDVAMLQSSTDPALNNHLLELRQSVTGLVEDVRDTVTELRDAQAISLAAHAARLNLGWPNDAPKLVVNLDEARPPLPALAPELAAIMGEAVRNARNHSGASEIRVEGRVDHARGEFTVSDDGNGFDVTLPKQGHYGLVGMKERANKIGATIDISSSAISGTRVAVAWSEEGSS